MPEDRTPETDDNELTEWLTKPLDLRNPLASMTPAEAAARIDSFSLGIWSR